MRFRYTFSVISQVRLDPAMRFSSRGFTFSFLGEDGRFTALVVETPSTEIRDRPKRSIQGGLPVLSAPDDPFRSTVQKDIRSIRGALTFWGVIDIDVDQPAVEFIPDTAAENDQLDIMGFDLKRNSREELPLLPPLPDMLVRCVVCRDRFIEHQIPFEFYRRGTDDVYYGRFIEAVYDFFFVLEYLFGRGKFSKRALLRNFSDSPALIEAVVQARTDAMQTIESPEAAKVFEQAYSAKSERQILEHIIETRGFLHHQSITRSATWNPAVQSEYEADAKFLRRTCEFLLLNMWTKILFDRPAVIEFLSTPVFSSDAKRIEWQPFP